VTQLSPVPFADTRADSQATVAVAMEKSRKGDVHVTGPSTTMRLRIGEYEIPEHTLANIELTVGTSTVTFSGMAREDEGVEIVTRLKELAAEEDAIPYEAIDPLGIRSMGLCNIANLRLEEVTTTPPMVLFSGEPVSPDSS